MTNCDMCKNSVPVDETRSCPHCEYELCEACYETHTKECNEYTDSDE